MTTFTWQFPQFDTAKAEGDLTDVVKAVHWRYVATEGEAVVQAYGKVSLAEADPAAFTAYADLTEPWAIAIAVASWGERTLADVQAELQTAIDVELDPPIVPLQPPFVEQPLPADVTALQGA